MELLDVLFPSEQDETKYDWPTVTGEVLSASYGGGGRNGYHATLSYFYPLNGEYYGGTSGKSFGSEEDASKFVSDFQRGRKILVHYQPDKPEVSTLLEDLEIEN